jgi:positive phototaxis protein PixI
MSSTAAPSQQKLQQFLRFRLPGNTQAMVPTQQLTEILSLNLSQIVPIPDIDPAMMGVCNWRGEVLWLVDFSCWLGMEPLYNQSLRRGKLNVVIIHHLGQTLGLGVDQIEQMIWCDRTQIQPAPMQHISESFSNCLQGCWSDPTGNLVLIFDAEAMMDCLK